jgi:hypothetical protein
MGNVLWIVVAVAIPVFVIGLHQAVQHANERGLVVG